MMDVTAVLNTLLHGNQLKRTARTGWVQRGAMQEVLAEATFAPAFMSLWEGLHAAETAVFLPLSPSTGHLRRACGINSSKIEKKNADVTQQFQF